MLKGRINSSATFLDGLFHNVSVYRLYLKKINYIFAVLISIFEVPFELFRSFGHLWACRRNR